MIAAASDGALADAVSSLLRLHRHRRWALRCLVLAIGAAVVLALALLFFAPRASGAALLLLPTFWACFLLADAALLLAWRARLLRRWRAGELNLGILAEGVATLPRMPKASTDAVLRSVPILPPLRDRDLTPAQRGALAAISDWQWAGEAMRALLPAVLLGLLCAAAAVAPPFSMAAATGFSLLALALAGPLILARIGLPAWLRRRAMSRLAELAPGERAAIQDFVEALGGPCAAGGNGPGSSPLR